MTNTHLWRRLTSTSRSWGLSIIVSHSWEAREVWCLHYMPSGFAYSLFVWYPTLLCLQVLLIWTRGNFCFVSLLYIFLVKIRDSREENKFHVCSLLPCAFFFCRNIFHQKNKFLCFQVLLPWLQNDTRKGTNFKILYVNLVHHGKFALQKLHIHIRKWLND